MAKKSKQPRATERKLNQSTVNPNLQNLTAEDIQKTLVANLDEAYRLDNLDRAIISVMMRFPGIAVHEIATSLGYSRPWISERMNRPGFKAAMSDIQKSVMEHLVEGQIEAIKRLKKEVHNDDAEIAINAAKALLAPLAKASENGSSNTNIYQNLVYAVKFGEGGQLIREIRPMAPEDFFLEAESKVAGE